MVNARLLSGGTVSYNNPPPPTFNESLRRFDGSVRKLNGWRVEQSAVALTIGDTVVQDWILKHGTPVTLHSDRGKEFTTALHQEVCELLCIAKTYSRAYRPQAKGMVERCNRTLLAML